MPNNRILITGATGFVGSYLTKMLIEQGYSLVLALRNEIDTHSFKFVDNCEIINIGNITPQTDWADALKNVSVVIHLANKAHIMNADSSTDFDTLNLKATLNLAQQARNAGVKQFIYLSSAKVNGETNHKLSNGQLIAFKEDLNGFIPTDPYALSKFKAEQALKELDSIKITIIRPPLIYGPRVGANFLKLIDLVQKNKILPFGASKNQRSLVFIGNLVDLISRCINNNCAYDQTFLVSDLESVSTDRLVVSIAQVLDKKLIDLAIPSRFFVAFLKIVGKKDLAIRLFDSFLIDSSFVRNHLDWQPPYSLLQGLKETINWYQAIKPNAEFSKINAIRVS